MKRKLMAILMAFVLVFGLSMTVYADVGVKRPFEEGEPVQSEETIPNGNTLICMQKHGT